MTDNEHEQPRHGVVYLDDWQGLKLYDRLRDDAQQSGLEVFGE